jgi:hypothetical protein
VQCDVCWSDAYKNQTDSLAKSVGQQKLDRFWLFRVNNPLVADAERFFFLKTAPSNLFYVYGSRQVSHEVSKALRTDASLVPPIRQTASIFKQPVTVTTLLSEVPLINIL